MTSNEALPPGWIETTLEQVIMEGPTNGYSPASSSTAEGPLTLKLTATTGGTLRLDSESTKRIHEQIADDSKLWLRPGDLLIQRSNTFEYVGSTAIFDGPERTYIYPAS